jgi:SseB protein N-terminal domain
MVIQFYYYRQLMEITPSNGGWKLMEKGAKLKLTSVFNFNGLKVLGAFTDESALMIWANKEIQYTAMKTQDVVNFCKENGIGRVVINSNQKNIFVLERNRDNLKSRVIEKETPAEIGMPKIPLNKTSLIN